MLSPLPAAAWSYEHAAHLLSRAGFGGTPEDIVAAQKQGLGETVKRLLDLPPEATEIEGPDWTRTIVPRRIEHRRLFRTSGMPNAENERFKHIHERNMTELRGWLLQRLLTSGSPLLEKMTLFWHGHFTTSFAKSHDTDRIWLQYLKLRRNALGSFVALAKTISRDAAMLVYLDLQESSKAHPNENWARELMELFTIGIGNYTENDVREAARAFTGYRIRVPDQQFDFVRAEHDDGPKTFLGKTGRWNGDDIIDILAQQPACSRFLANKLWKFFAQDKAPSQIVDAVASSIRTHNFEMRPVLREMFTAADFYSDAAMRTQIKSPIQFVVQTAKVLGAELPPAPLAENAFRQMGQIPFAPPNVKGWDGGKAWISTSTLLFRYNFAKYLIEGDAMLPGARKPPQPNAPVREPIAVTKLAPTELRENPAELVTSLYRRLFGVAPQENQRAVLVQFVEKRRPDTSDAVIRELLHLMTSTPEFQLT